MRFLSALVCRCRHTDRIRWCLICELVQRVSARGAPRYGHVSPAGILPTPPAINAPDRPRTPGSVYPKVAPALISRRCCPRQRKALIFIEAEIERSGGVAPTVREIAAHLSYRSTSPVRRLLVGLEQRGHIRRISGKVRAIEVVRPVSRLTAYQFDGRSKTLKPLCRQ